MIAPGTCRVACACVDLPAAPMRERGFSRLGTDRSRHRSAQYRQLSAPRHASTVSGARKFWLEIARTLLAAFMAIVWSAAAHAAPTAEKTYLATISVNDRTVHYEMTVDVSTLGGLQPKRSALSSADGTPVLQALQRAVDGKLQIRIDAVPCHAGAVRVIPLAPGATNAQVSVDFSCPADPEKMIVRYDLFDSLGSAHRTLALIVWPGGSQQFMFTPDAREVRLDLATGSLISGETKLTPLGAQRMLIGWYHLLFLLCLLLPVRRLRPALIIVLAFAAAQSLAIFAAGLGYAGLPWSIITSAIALSIVWVAAENLLLGDKVVRYRWLVAFVFGLFHGLSLTMALKQFTFPDDSMPYSLLRFIFGVEIGLAFLVTIAAPLLAWMHRNRWQSQASTAISGLALATGIALLAGRLFS